MGEKFGEIFLLKNSISREMQEEIPLLDVPKIFLTFAL